MVVFAAVQRLPSAQYLDDMATRSKPVATQQRRHDTSGHVKEFGPGQTLANGQEEETANSHSLRRSLRPRAGNCILEVPSAVSKATSRKRSRTIQVLEDVDPGHIDTIPLSRQTHCPSKLPKLDSEALSSPPKAQSRRRQRELGEEEHHQDRLQKSKRRRVPTPTLDTAIERSSCVSEWVGKLPDSFPANMTSRHRLAERKSSASLRRRRSDSLSSATSVPHSDQKSRDGKSATYAHKGYQMLLRIAGVLLESELSVSDDSEIFCQSLLKTKCRIPEGTLLSDDSYRETITDLQERNESRVIQDVGRLYVPSVQTLAKRGEDRFRAFVESVNEAWDCCYPLVDPRPQPDYAVGFGRSGLTEARIGKLQPLIRDDPTFRSEYTATYYMYFPFFATEVKCGTSGLVIADRQNGHTMGVCIKGILSIYRLAGKEEQLHNTPIAFTVAHDHRMLRLTGWGPVIDGDFYTVHPLTIHSFDVTPFRGLERWTPYRYTIGVYEYGLTLLDNIKAIIDELPDDLNLGKVQPLRLGLNTSVELLHMNRSGLSQQIDGYTLPEDTEVVHSQLSSFDLQESTAPTSVQAGNSSKKVKT